MKSLTLRIYLSVVAVLALFALASGWIVDRALSEQRNRTEAAVAERWTAWGELMQHALPPAQAPLDEQTRAIQEWSRRMRMPLALDDAQGRRLVTTVSFARRQLKLDQFTEFSLALEDGRTIRAIRPLPSSNNRTGWGWWLLRASPDGNGRDWPAGLGIAILLALLFAAVAGGAWPVARALTRRLHTLQSGVQAFGSGQLSRRVEVEGRDEVAAVAQSFNQAAQRIEALVASHRSLLANASHELRSPLARLKMALAMLDSAQGERRAGLQAEIERNISELDALVEEVLLASRLDAQPEPGQTLRLDFLALAAEEAAFLELALEGQPAWVLGEERLLRRAVRNLLENALRYGGSDVNLQLAGRPGVVQLRVSDRGAGVPDAEKTRIFEPFYRLPGHAEKAGGVGLGLSLVRQIALRHHGRVWCEDRPGGGSCFVLELPAAQSHTVTPSEAGKLMAGATQP